MADIFGPRGAISTTTAPTYGGSGTPGDTYAKGDLDCALATKLEPDDWNFIIDNLRIAARGKGVSDANINDPTMLLKAILTDARFGNDESKILFNNTYPTILNVNNTCVLGVPSAGSISFDAFVWLWRDSKVISTPTETFATVASKTYHLKVKYDYANDTQTVGLYDVADVAYNPSAVSQLDTSLDASYDEIFIAKIVTNGANVATITPYINMPNLYAQDDITAVSNNTILDNSKASDQTPDKYYTLNWPRTPNASLVGITDINGTGPGVEYGFGLVPTREWVGAWFGWTLPSTDGVNMMFSASA